MKCCCVQVICLTILALLLANNLALAAGPGPSGGIGQSTQPTTTHQVFAPVVSGGGDSSSPDASVPAGSVLPVWLLGVGVLVVLVGGYLALQLGKRGRK